jgi:hypothetical protein
MRPLASLLAAVTTVASPAVLSACLALCLPGMRGHQMTAVAGPEATVAAAEAGCAEHAAPAPVAPAAAVTASDAGCCVEGLTEPAPSVTAERAGPRLGLTSELAPLMAWTSAPFPSAAARVRGDRGAPPPPLRRPSVLRI